MKNIKTNLKITYLFLIALLFLHTTEEIIGKAPFITTFYNGLNNYLIAHFFFLLIPIILFLYTLDNKKWFYNLNYIYAAVMIMDGLYHVIERLVAGLYTGIGLIIFGLLLIYYLWRNKK